MYAIQAAQYADRLTVTHYIGAIHRGLIEAADEGYELQDKFGCWDWVKINETISLRSWAFGAYIPDEGLYAAALAAYKAECKYERDCELL